MKEAVQVLVRVRPLLPSEDPVKDPAQQEVCNSSMMPVPV